MLGARLRTPRGDRDMLVRPALTDMPALVVRNHQYLAQLDFPVLGEPFQSVRAAARHEFADGADLVVQTGHQPTPYHPGVWIKNFLAHRLAARVGALPLNLIVDNDTAKHLELRIPRTTSDGGAAVTTVPLTETPPAPGVAYEECPAPSPDFLGEIGRRVADGCSNEGTRAGFEAFWRLVREAHGQGQTIAELITAARHRLEMAAGVDNREILISAMSGARPFRLLLLHILGEVKRFVDVHNAALADYRRARGIRNRANPLPDLAVEGNRFELPYWVWRAGEPRSRLMAHLGSQTIELRRGDETVLSASRGALLDTRTGPCSLAEAAGRGWKIRPRAISTTMFCRLFVADVFIHGIGGALYDLVTDQIIQEFFGVEPPPYIVCSATVRLPGFRGRDVRPPRQGGTDTFCSVSGADALRHQRWLSREFTYNPDRHLGKDQLRREPFQSLVKRKWDLIGRPRGTTPSERREAFVNIRQTNASMREAGLTERVLEVRHRIECLQRQLAADGVLSSREYAFCLFPPGVLPAFYDQALAELTL